MDSASKELANNGDRREQIPDLSGGPRRSLFASEEHAQNGARREAVPDPDGGARRAPCAFDAEKAEKNVVAAAVLGIDVSHYQPAIDWATVVRAGFQYCFIKATEGMASVDRSFVRHWQDARKAGLIRGAYHFFRPTVPVALQAALFVRTVKQLQAGDLPPVLDPSSTLCDAKRQ